MKLTSICAIALAFAFHAQAELLTLTPGSATKKGVNISAGATADLGGKKVALTTVGSGVRAKDFVIAVDVYVGQLLLSDSGRFVKSAGGALASLDNQNTVAMRMSFLRKLNAQSLREGFIDGLVANNVNINEPDVAKLLQWVAESGGVVPGSNLSVVFNRNANGTETMHFELTGAAGLKSGVHTGAKGFTQKVVSSWLGNPCDDLMGEFKAELLQ